MQGRSLIYLFMRDDGDLQGIIERTIKYIIGE